jgi:hypothetical protein
MEKLKNKVRFLLLFLFLNNLATAQEIVPANWELKFSRDNWKENDTVTLYLIGNIPEHQSVYSTNFNCDLGPMPSKLVFTNAGTNYLVVDSAKSVGEKPEYDDIFECTMKKFKGKALIKQVVKMNTKQAEIKGYLEYQTCTDAMCLQYRVYFETKGSKVLKVQNGR